MRPSAQTKTVLFLSLGGAVMWWPLAYKFLGRSPHFLRDLGFVSGPSASPSAWALALVTAAVYAAYAVHRIPLVRQHWRALSWFKLLSLVVAVSAAVVEEAFFRRLLMDQLLRAGSPAGLQIAVSGLLFGLAHGLWGILTGNLVVGIRTMIATGTLGTALALVFVMGDRSLAPVIVAHFIVTAAIQPGIMLAAFEGRMRHPTHH